MKTREELQKEAHWLTKLDLVEFYCEVKMSEYMLTTLFTAQNSLTQMYFNKYYGGEPTTQQIEQELPAACDYLAEEVFELKRHFNYKPWKQKKPIDYTAAKEELIDILHFVLQIALLMGFTPEEFYEEYMKKNQINFDRQKEGY